MRGNFRLDSVARSLALTSLGLLGLSAVVADRWMAEFPAVPAPVLGVTTPAVQVALTLPDSSPATPAHQARPRPSSGLTSRASNHDTAAETAFAPANDFIDSGPNQLPVTPAAEAVEPVVALAALSVPLPVVDTWQPVLPPIAVPDERSDERFFSGMLKRTSSSVSTSIGKAGNSVAGAVRVLGDVVKRAF